MNGKSRRILITLALSALGAGLLLLLTRTGATDVQAEQSIEQPAEARVEPVSAQAMYDLRLLFVDGYDGTYTSTYKIPRAITYTAGSAPYTWGRVLTSTTEFTDTLWCVRGEMGASLDPDTGFYTDGVTTTVTYGPFSLRDAITIELEFSHWVSMSVGEAFEWGVSTDGSTYTYTEVTTTTAGDWETTILSSASTPALADLLDQDTVYVAFRFQSDNDALVDRGVFLDDIQVRTTYDTRTFLPLIFRDWFEEYTYTENFEPPYQSPAWPYGSVRNAASVDEEFAYGYMKDGDGSNVYFISIRDNYDHVFLTGPAYVMGDTWDYRAYMRRASSDGVDLREYGILISPTPINPKNPDADGVYTFHIRMGYGGLWLVKKWDIYSLGSRKGYEQGWPWKGTTGHLTEAVDKWNTFRIRRRGDTLYFDAMKEGESGLYEITHIDIPDLADTYYVGFFASNNAVTSWREWQFDNVYIHAEP